MNDQIKTPPHILRYIQQQQKQQNTFKLDFILTIIFVVRN